MQASNYRHISFPIRVLISIDQFLNVVILQGDPDETISSRGGKALLRIKNGTAKPTDYRWETACKIIGFILMNKNHCIDNIEYDEAKM